MTMLNQNSHHIWIIPVSKSSPSEDAFGKWMIQPPIFASIDQNAYKSGLHFGYNPPVVLADGVVIFS